MDSDALESVKIKDFGEPRPGLWRTRREKSPGFQDECLGIQNIVPMIHKSPELNTKYFEIKTSESTSRYDNMVESKQGTMPPSYHDTMIPYMGDVFKMNTCYAI